MATVKKRGPRKRHDPRNLTEGQYRDLVFGWVLDFDGVPFDSQEMRRKCWELHKDEIMLRRGKENSFAYPTFEHGSRPAAWWDYSNESDEPRKRWKKTIRMGSPPGYEVEVNEYETDLDYLERTGQLFTDEKRLAIKAKEDKEKWLKNMARVTDLGAMRDSKEGVAIMSGTEYSKVKMGQEDAWRSQGGKLILDPDDPFTVLFFAPYGELSDPINEAGKRFREKILPRAFSPSLGKGMVACFYEHNPDRVLGIEGVNMTIAEAEDGLRCRVQLEPTTFNMALIDSVSANELQASVGMSVLRDRWPKSDERHVVSAILREISLVHRGAYPQTSSCFSRPPGKERSLP